MFLRSLIRITSHSRRYSTTPTLNVGSGIENPRMVSAKWSANAGHDPNVASRLDFGFRRKLEVVLQTEVGECGLACIAMIANFFGRYTDLGELRRDYPISLKGTAATDLVKIAHHLDLATRGVSLNLDQLKRLKSPSVLHWNFNHFVVLKEVGTNYLIVIDPAVGLRRLSLDEASKNFTGVAIEFWPAPKFSLPESRVRKPFGISQLTGKTPGLISLLTQTILLAIGIEILTLILPLMTQWIVDYVILSRDSDLLMTCALGFGAAMLTQQALSFMRGWVILFLGTNLNIQWQANVFTHLVKLPVDYFQRRHLGDIVSRFGSVEQIQSTMTTSFMTAILDGIMSCATFVCMFIYDWRLTLIVLVAVFAYVLVRITTYVPLRGNAMQRIIFGAKQQSHFLETMRGIKAIKLFQREVIRRHNWLNLLVQQTNASLKTQRAQLIFQTSSGLLFGLERIVILWLGAKFVMEGAFTVGALMAFNSYRENFGSRIISLTDRYFEFRMLGLHTSRLSDIVMTPPEPEHGRIPVTQDLDIEPTLEFRDLHFKYAANESWVLRRLYLKINAGETVVITGESGCGKTTLLNILLGILKPERGQYLVGGLDLRNVGIRAFRRNVASVTQDDTIFAGSIAENISFFDEHPNQEQIEYVAKLAAIHDDISKMPMGYRTLVGDMGAALSGGQKQRLFIARALYRKPRILILDEATSHLDVSCEGRVNAAIKSLQITRVIVAHRPETIALADRVILIEKGIAKESSSRSQIVEAPSVKLEAIENAKGITSEGGYQLLGSV